MIRPLQDAWTSFSRVLLAFCLLSAHYQELEALSLARNISGQALRRLNDNSNPLAVNVRRFRSFGAARYADSQSVLRWGDLVGQSSGKLGAICDAAGHHGQCGNELVCRKSVCRHCISDRECPSLHSCVLGMDGVNLCVHDKKKAWERVVSDPFDFLCTVLIFFSSTLSAAAGTGGGGMFVPLLVLLTQLKPEEAVALSQCMILCSSLVNLFFFVAQRHTSFIAQPRIDYDCVVLFEPMLCLGVTMGVLLHQVAPGWLLLTLLCASLGVALWRTASKGLKQWKEEQMKPRAGPQPQESKSYCSEVADLTRDNSRQVCGILLVWSLLLLFSFHGLSPCTWRFFLVLTGLAALLVGFTVAVHWWVLGTGRTPKPIDWTAASDLTPRSRSPLDSLTYPLIAFSAGLLGGLLGLGGGIIMSPVLVEVGMQSEAVQATTAVIVFLSSSLATIQFAVLDSYVWHYVLWYCAVAVVATIFGQRACAAYLQRTGNTSVITLAIAGVLLFSLMTLSVVGTLHTMEDVQFGRQLWFSTTQLCSGGSHGILDIDITPAQAWPKDMPGTGLSPG
mmetsp:Transcript_19689/g.36912  ORF Transcript_19689/g.36912 Transcript_19689/m.36912 type:complete len:562 (+) Transcript_19689:99-1784(+)